MIRHRLFAWILIAGLLLAACAPAQTQAPGAVPTGSVSVPGGTQSPPAELEVTRWLADQLGVPVEDVTLKDFELVDWPNACLGLPEEGEMCAEVVTPGFRMEYEAGGETYEVHTNLDNSVMRLAGDSGPKGGPVGDIPAAEAARRGLAEQMGVDLETVKIVSAEAVQWPDSCLGVANPAESCLAAITPGYRVMLDVDGVVYQVNTNQDGSYWRVPEEPAQGPSGDVEGSDDAVLSARLYLAQQLGLSQDEVRLVSVEPVDFPNSCLGIETPGVMCAQVITPGYRVLLEANGQQYAFHTDQAGGAVVSALTPLPDDAEQVVVWTLDEGGSCTQVEVGAQDVMSGGCGETLQSAELPEPRKEELAYMYGDFMPFEAETSAGMVKFNGAGSRMPSEAEMRSVAEWARLVMLEVRNVRGMEEHGLVVSWTREGGFAGFCDQASFYSSGWVVTSTCKAGQDANPRSYRLSGEELDRMYAWLDTLDSFETVQTDSATADSMKVTVEFNGNGETEPSEDVQQEIGQFADRIYTAP